MNFSYINSVGGLQQDQSDLFLYPHDKTNLHENFQGKYIKTGL